LFAAQTDHALAHHRCGRRGDRAGFAAEGDVAQHILIDVQFDTYMIATQRIVTVGMVRRLRQRTMMPRRPMMIEHNLLIEIDDRHGA
jgi:hypothetical protein